MFGIQLDRSLTLTEEMVFGYLDERILRIDGKWVMRGCISSTVIRDER